MKKIVIIAAILVAAFVSGRLGAQSIGGSISLPGPVVLIPAAGTTLASCVTSPAVTQFCATAAGLYQSIAGAAFIPISGAAPAINALTINGKVCNLGTVACSFTLSGAAAAPSAATTVGAPPITLSVQ